MLIEKRNIIQAEFFHVGGGSQSLEDMMQECVERARDGTPIKTVVRFFDPDETITPFALQFAKKEKERRVLEKTLLGARGGFSFERILANRRHKLHSKKIRSMKEEAKLLAVRQLKAVTITSSEIALECRHDHSFRLIREDEVHELLEAADAAVDVWLFVFSPNPLLGDTQSLVVSVM